MATLQNALTKATQRVNQQVEKKAKALEELKKFKEMEKEIMADISLPAELQSEFKKYMEDQSALEIWDIHPEAKKLDKGDVLNGKRLR